MPVEQVPGFWDYLAGGVDKGIERSREDVRFKQQQASQNASLVGQLFGMGAVDDTALSGALQRAGMPQGVVIKSKAQRRKEALDSGSVDALSDDEKRELGFQTGTEKKIDAAKGAEADFSTKRSEAMLRAANGEDLSDVDAEITGISNKKDRELQRLGKMDGFLGQVGERFVAGAINQIPTGKIAAGQAKQISEKAYADYVANRTQSGLGNLTPEEILYTKSYFDRATQNAIIAQTKLDIADYEAKSGRIAANQPRNGMAQNPGLQWFKTLNTTTDILRKKQDDIVKANPAVMYALDNPQFAANPVIAGALAEYQEAGRQLEEYRAAMSQLGDGTIPANMNELLARANAQTQPPKGAPQGAPPAIVPAGKVGQAVLLITQGKGTLEQLQQAVQAGAFTAAEYEQVLQQVKAAQKGKTK